MTGTQAAAPVPFAAQVGDDGQRAFVRLSGELDIATAAQGGLAIARAERDQAPTLELDLSGLTFIDSTGLRLLLAVRERALAADRRLVLRRGPYAVQRILEITALASLFEFVD